jgi:glycosyltransferase involved in cell wall biosynthesis
LRIGIDGRYIQDHFPGIGRYTYNLIKALHTVAPEEDFVIFHNPQLLNTRYDVDELGRHPNIQLVPVDVPPFSLKEQYRLPLLVKRFSLELLHSPYYVKPYWLPCQSVMTFYDVVPLLYPEYLPSWWAKPLFNLTARLALRRAAGIITISQSARDDLLSFFSLPKRKVWVTPLGVDQRFKQLKDELIADLRQRYRLPPRYILHLGINKPHKNLVHLLEVFSRLDTETKLLLAGREDARYPQAHQVAEQLSLAKRVLFLGEVADDDLPLLYSGATLFVFPSLYEGFGLPVLEAMACGTPVVCSNSSSLPEIVGDAAIMLDPLDQEAWLATIRELLQSEALREKMRAKGLQRARMFSWEETARRTWEAYLRILR